MIIKSLFSRKNELVDEIENFCFGLKNYIKDIKIALVEFGYADGLPWSLKSTNHQSGGQFYFDNAPTPILGRVSMDIVAIDVTGIKNDIKRGDFVEIIGSNQNFDTLAKNAGTISYEILTRLNSRVKKRYKYV